MPKFNFLKKYPKEKEWWIRYKDYSFGRLHRGMECRINGFDNGIVIFSYIRSSWKIKGGFAIQTLYMNSRKFLDNFEYCENQNREPIRRFLGSNNLDEITVFNLDKPWDNSIVENRNT